MDTAHYSVYKKAAPPSFKGTLNTLNLFNSPLSSVICGHSLDLIATQEGFERPRPNPLFLFVCAGRRPLIVRGLVPRNPSNIDCWLLALDFYHNSLAPSVGTRVLYAPAQSQSTQTKCQNISADQVGRGRRQAPSSSLREKSSSESSKTPTRLRKGRSPRRGDHARARDKSTSQKIRDLDARLDAINTGVGAPVTVDTLIKQTEPPFTERILRARISSKFKLPAQLGMYEGKTDPMDHLDSYKSLMSLQGCSDEVMCKAFSATLKGPARSWFRKLSPGTIDSFGDLSRLFVANFMSCRNRQKNASHLFTIHQKENESLKEFVKRFNQAILEVEDPSDKVIIMAMMERLRPGPLFDSLSKNVPETLSALQSKADKYIAAEELAEAKHRRRGKDDHKRKEPDTRRADYREETRYKRPDRDPKHSNNRRPRTPPRCPELSYHHSTPLSPKRYGDNRPTAGNIQTIHGGFGSGGCSTSSRKKHARSAFRSIEEEVYNLFSPCVGDQPPITFGSDDLRGLHLPHDDALVISAVIANFNVQRILIDSGSSADILFISAFEKMKFGLDKLHPFHSPLIGFGGNTTQPLGWINLPITLGTEPHQTTVWQDFIVVDCPSPYNAILGRPTLGGIKAITSTYHLKMKFPTLTGIGEKAGDDTGILRNGEEQLILEDPRETENTKPLEEVVPISIHPNFPDRQVMIGTELTDELRIALIDFLKKNSDVFAWSQGDVPGIDPEVAMHKLFTKSECIPLEFLTSPSIGIANQVLQTEENPTWLDEIIAYLQEGILPRDKLQARRLQYRSARFCIFEGRLYKRSFSGSLLRCLRPEEAEYVLREIHEGICGNHSGARSLAKKTIRQGYFWPTIKRDAAAYIKKCDKCQRFAPVSRLPHTEMVPMSSPWPFAQWGIDILGPLPQAPLQRKFLIVAIDYFTKWIEAQPLAKITEKNTRDFVWKHLICRFGVPKVIISDNAKQFDNDRFRLFCSNLAISHHFSSPGHPQANGQVEVTNRTVLRKLKASHTGGIGMPSFRVSTFDKETNEAELRLNLDLLEERRESAFLRQTAYKCQVAK
ncbi:hypothetical protein Acr_28g0000010, partial [Actinidia rufa]